MNAPGAYIAFRLGVRYVNGMTEPSISAALSELRARRAVIDRAIAALEDVERSTQTPAARGPAGESGAAARRRAGRRTRDAGGGAGGVAKVLRARPGVPMNADELADAMIANGWVTDAQDKPRAARAAANRLRRSDPQVRLEHGRFVFRPDGVTPRLAFVEEEGGDP